MANIRLHKEHGVNPTISQCPLCGGDKNEVVLLGSACKERAPMRMVVNNEPCDECKEMMKAGILLISVRDGTDQKNPFRTGKKFSIKEEAFERIFGEIPGKRVAFIEDSCLVKLGFPETA
jgi:hypothetical protein